MCLFDSTWVPAYVGIPWTLQKGYTLALRNGLGNPFIFWLVVPYKNFRECEPNPRGCSCVRLRSVSLVLFPL